MTPPISTIALWRSFRRILFVGALLLLIAIGTGAAIVVQAGRSDNPPADAAIVMLTDDRGSTTRLDRARQLYTEGKVSRILLAGTDSAASRTTLLERGIKEESLIDLSQPSQREQLIEAKRILDEQRLSTTLLIAEPVETLRLLKIANDHELQLLTLPTGTNNDIDPVAVAREIGRYFSYVLLGN